MLGVISDVGFVVNKFDKSEDEKLDAGIDLCRLIKKDNPNMPFLLQSSQESMREVARQARGRLSGEIFEKPCFSTSPNT
ncbi:MAG: hypothetical protein L6V35_09865 [Alistipes putredinis]|nr:MAG: hypothetical protein L6V35_09865 [Alistipes putredinis]